MVFIYPRVGGGVDECRKTVAKNLSVPPKKRSGSRFQYPHVHPDTQAHSVGLAIVVNRVGGSWKFFALGPPYGMDRSCAATIYPVLEKPRTTGALQDRRKIRPFFRPPSSFV
jgi:hypothetical protein